jgi:hypothetical protein
VLEQNTILSLLVALTAALPVLLERIPRWQDVNPNVKKLIVLALGLIAAYALNVAKAFIPADILNANAANFIVGLFTAAGMFVVHLVDTWLDSLA